MSSELRECPFCKAIPDIKTDFGLSWGRNYRVKCHYCKAFGPTSPVVQTAIELWNQRSSDGAREGVSPRNASGGGPVNEPDELGCRYCRECDVFCPTLNEKGATTQ